MEAVTPKFQIGQQVKTADGETCVVQTYAFDGKQFSYRVSSKEVDLQAKELVKGVKNVLESELEAIETEEQPEA